MSTDLPALAIVTLKSLKATPLVDRYDLSPFDIDFITSEKCSIGLPASLKICILPIKSFILFDTLFINVNILPKVFCHKKVDVIHLAIPSINLPIVFMNVFPNFTNDIVVLATIVVRVLNTD